MNCSSKVKIIILCPSRVVVLLYIFAMYQQYFIDEIWKIFISQRAVSLLLVLISLITLSPHVLKTTGLLLAAWSFHTHTN